MKLARHKVQDVAFQPARWAGGSITPEIVILHDTASSLNKGSAANYLAENSAKVSVHFVVETDGTIVQQVATNRRANHAGKSSYNGRADCNGFSIGIEIVNAGKMTRVLPSSANLLLAARSWWGQAFVDNDQTVDLVEMSTPEHGDGVWMSYPAEQIAAVEQLLACLFRDIPTLRDITTHWYVSPGRKVDVNPLFPLAHIRARVLGRDDPADADADAATIAVPGGSFVQVVSPVSPLNLRRWPSFNPNVIGTVPHGAVLPVLGRGDFASQRWLKVLFDGREGWVVERYTATMP